MVNVGRHRILMTTTSLMTSLMTSLIARVGRHWSRDRLRQTRNGPSFVEGSFLRPARQPRYESHMTRSASDVGSQSYGHRNNCEGTM